MGDITGLVNFFFFFYFFQRKFNKNRRNLIKPENVDRVPVEEWAGDLEEVARLRTFFSGAEAKASLNRAFEFL